MNNRKFVFVVLVSDEFTELKDLDLADTVTLEQAYYTIVSFCALYSKNNRALLPA
jgi:hypothetical protein